MTFKGSKLLQLAVKQKNAGVCDNTLCTHNMHFHFPLTCMHVDQTNPQQTQPM